MNPTPLKHNEVKSAEQSSRCFVGSSCFIDGRCTKQPAVAALTIAAELAFTITCGSEREQELCASKCNNSLQASDFCKDKCDKEVPKPCCYDDSADIRQCNEPPTVTALVLTAAESNKNNTI